MEEKRKFVRLDTDKLGISLKKEDASEDIGDAKNISGGGVCLLLDEKKISVGDVLSIQLNLPNEKIITTKGRVVWISEFEIVGGKSEKKFEAGIEFLSISPYIN